MVQSPSEPSTFIGEDVELALHQGRGQLGRLAAPVHVRDAGAHHPCAEDDDLLRAVGLEALRTAAALHDEHVEHRDQRHGGDQGHGPGTGGEQRVAHRARLGQRPAEVRLGGLEGGRNGVGHG